MVLKHILKLLYSYYDVFPLHLFLIWEGWGALEGVPANRGGWGELGWKVAGWWGAMNLTVLSETTAPH